MQVDGAILIHTPPMLNTSLHTPPSLERPMTIQRPSTCKHAEFILTSHRAYFHVTDKGAVCRDRSLPLRRSRHHTGKRHLRHL